MKKNIIASSIAGVFIGLLSLPIINNLSALLTNLSLPYGIQGVVDVFVGSYFATFIGFFIITLLVGLIGFYLGKWIKVLFQITKFGIVGVLNTFVDFGVLNLLITVFSIATGFWYSVFKGISFLVAVANSYAWNKYWTFESDKKSDYNEALSFIVVSGIGFVINVLVATVVVNWVPNILNTSDIIWANIGALLGTFFGLAWNFIGYKFFVFEKKER